MAFELLWNGQTPGKRLANTQVVRANGAPAEFGEVAIRNVVRIIDFLPFAYAIGFVVMFLNRRSRRLGDFAANTLVIKRQDQVKLSDLISPAPRPAQPHHPAQARHPAQAHLPARARTHKHGACCRHTTRSEHANRCHHAGRHNHAAQREHPPGSAAAAAPPVSITAETLAHFPNLSQMSEDEYQLVRETLARDAAGKADADLLRRLAAAMAIRVGARPPAPDRHSSRAFLALLADAYMAVTSQGGQPPATPHRLARTPTCGVCRTVPGARQLHPGPAHRIGA